MTGLLQIKIKIGLAFSKIKNSVKEKPIHLNFKRDTVMTLRPTEFLLIPKAACRC